MFFSKLKGLVLTKNDLLIYNFKTNELVKSFALESLEFELVSPTYLKFIYLKKEFSFEASADIIDEWVKVLTPIIKEKIKEVK